MTYPDPIARFEQTIEPLHSYPSHAGAIQQAYPDLMAALSDLESRGANRRQTNALREHFRQAYSEDHSNEWFTSMGDSLRALPRQLRRLQQETTRPAPDAARVGIFEVYDRADQLKDPRITAAIQRASELLEAEGYGATPQRLFLVSPSELPLTHPTAAAAHVSRHDDIYLGAPIYDGRDPLMRLLHEFGHQVWSRSLSERERREWREQWQQRLEHSSHWPSSYARTSPQELFAESFAHRLAPTPNPQDTTSPRNALERMRAELEANRARRRAVAELFQHTGIVSVGSPGREVFMVLHPSTTIPSGWQVSLFDRNGPFSHIERRCQEDAIGEAVEDYGTQNARAVTEADFMKLSATSDFRTGTDRTSFVTLTRQIDHEFGDRGRDVRLEAESAPTHAEGVKILREGLIRLRRARKGKSNPERAASLSKRLSSLRPNLAAAAQVVYDAWEQDEELGYGGICQDVAEALCDVLSAAGIECGTQDNNGVGEQHVWAVAYDDDKAFIVDIPPGTYETGGGYAWKRRPNVEIGPGDVSIEAIDHRDLDTDDPDPTRNPLEPYAHYTEAWPFVVRGEDPHGRWYDGVHTASDYELAALYAVQRAMVSNSVAVVFHLDVSGLVPLMDRDAEIHRERGAPLDLLEDDDVRAALADKDTDALYDAISHYFEFQEQSNEHWQSPETWVDAAVAIVEDNTDNALWPTLNQLDPQQLMAAMTELRDRRDLPAGVWISLIGQQRYLSPIGLDRVVQVDALRPVDFNLCLDDDYVDDDPRGPQRFTQNDFLDNNAIALPDRVVLWRSPRLGELRLGTPTTRLGPVQYHGTDLTRARLAFPELAPALVNPWPYTQSDGSEEKEEPVANPEGTAVFTGWTCPSGPGEFVDWLVRRSQRVSFRTFIKHVPVREIGEAMGQPWIKRKDLADAWHISWLRSELLDGTPVWVMQWSGIEHLFAEPGVDYYETSELAPVLVDYLEEITGDYSGSKWTRAQINAAVALARAGKLERSYHIRFSGTVGYMLPQRARDALRLLVPGLPDDAWGALVEVPLALLDHLGLPHEGVAAAGVGEEVVMLGVPRHRHDIVEVATVDLDRLDHLLGRYLPEELASDLAPTRTTRVRR